MNPMQLIQMIRGGNPQQIVMNLLKTNSENNPILQNLLGLAQNNDTKGIENFARNMLKERGMDFDKEFNAFKQNLGL